MHLDWRKSFVAYEIHYCVQQFKGNCVLPEHSSHVLKLEPRSFYDRDLLRVWSTGIQWTCSTVVTPSDSKLSFKEVQVYDIKIRIGTSLSREELEVYA